ncbi:MAG: cytochrome c-type biogenesis protein CcmH/NrfG [Enterobacterales bacterium]|jgi:cytochrome c-type biogenesis protein CcmH/NrfG
MTIVFILFVILIVIVIIPSQLLPQKKALQDVHSSLDVRLEQLKRDFQFRTKELARRLKSNDLDEDEWKVITEELENDTRTSIDLTNIASQTSKTNSSWFFVLLLVVSVIVVSAVSYKYSGTYALSKNQLSIIKQLENDPETISKLSTIVNTDRTQERLNDLYLALRSNVEVNPTDVIAWRELAMFNVSYGRLTEATEAMEIALKIAPADLDLKIAFAQILTQSKDTNDILKALKIINKVLDTNPDHESALLLLGMSYYQFGMYQKSIITLERLLKLYEPGSEMANIINIRLVNAQQLIASQGQETAKPTKSKAVSSANLDIKVVIPKAIRTELSGNENIFIFAKAVDGPAFPVAVIKTTIDQLSAVVKLTDANAMQPQFALSKYDKVQITVRISFAGDVVAKAGDIQGVSEVIEAPYEGSTITVTLNEKI